MLEEHHHSENYASIYTKIYDNSWQNIINLDLSNNNIIILPKELGTLPCLQELDLSNNLLGLSIESTWTWLDQQAVQNNLYLLDISNNQLDILPAKIKKLNVLMMLNVSNNLLEIIPQSIGFYKALEYLDLSDNRLLYLPASMNQLSLQYLDVSRNTFLNTMEESVIHTKRLSLCELAARYILKHGIDYSSLPLLIIEYLENAKFCWLCGIPCFESCGLYYLWTNLILFHFARHVLAYDVRENIYVEYCYCNNCLKTTLYSDSD